jgi:hypothetical protein
MVDNNNMVDNDNKDDDDDQHPCPEWFKILNGDRDNVRTELAWYKRLLSQSQTDIVNFQKDII